MRFAFSYLWYMLDVDLCWCNMYGDAYQCIAMYLNVDNNHVSALVCFMEKKIYYPGRSMFKTIVTFGAAFWRLRPWDQTDSFTQGANGANGWKLSFTAHFDKIATFHRKMKSFKLKFC